MTQFHPANVKSWFLPSSDYLIEYWHQTQGSVFLPCHLDGGSWIMSSSHCSTLSSIFICTQYTGGCHPSILPWWFAKMCCDGKFLVACSDSHGLEDDPLSSGTPDSEDPISSSTPCCPLRTGESLDEVLGCFWAKMLIMINTNIHTERQRGVMINHNLVLQFVKKM